MKIAITYTEEEKALLSRAVAALIAILPPVKMRKRDRLPPYFHVYITTRKAKGGVKSNGNA